MTTRGKLILTLLILGVVGFGVWQWRGKLGLTNRPGQPGANSNAASAPASEPNPAELVETQTEIPTLAPAGAYQPKDNTVDIELSEYAGYAGFIVANGGLAPSTNSYFYQKHGFKLNIKLSEEESWPALNSGKMAASATTVDVLAVYGKQFQVVVPAQIGRASCRERVCLVV